MGEAKEAGFANFKLYTADLIPLIFSDPLYCKKSIAEVECVVEV